MSDDRRNFLKKAGLASLALGTVPSLTQAQNKSGKTCDQTTRDLYGEGPFYTQNPPQLVDNKLADDAEPGTPMIISGRVFDLNCNDILPNTIIDVWHANDAGQYDNNGFNLRGIVQSNAQGLYTFQTVKPGKYLNGNEFRPSHIHFKITPPGYPTLTTQLYFSGDADLNSDAASSVNSGEFDATSRIIDLEMNSNGQLEGTWDIIIDGDGISTGMNEPMHLDKGMIYKSDPNPFTEELTIRLGVFRQAEVELSAYDLNGRLVEQIVRERLSANKYEFNWKPGDQVESGHYFLVLSINQLQVHHLKVHKIAGADFSYR